MVTQAYRDWVRVGMPWRKARPVAEMEAWAKANNVPVLGTIGNEDHLRATRPEDHTPFSFTAWPVPLPGHWVCAVDLADVRGLGAAIHRDAKAGRLPWLKYMNYAGKNYVFADRFERGAPNSDRHVHLSVFSDALDTSTNDYDPFGEPMLDADEIALAVWRYKNEKLTSRDAYSHLRGADNDQDLMETLTELQAKVAELADLVRHSPAGGCGEVVERLERAGRALTE